MMLLSIKAERMESYCHRDLVRIRGDRLLSGRARGGIFNHEEVAPEV
jgi:hypothetical protein